MATKKIQIVGSIVPQSDYSQTDSTQPDYIKNKLGDLVATESIEELINIPSLPLAEDAGGIYDTYFEHQFIHPTIGDVVQVEIKLLNSENFIIFNNVEVLNNGDDDPFIVVNTNQTNLDTTLEEGLVKIDSALPAFFLYLLDNEVDLISWEDYTGASIVVGKKEITNDYIKLPNEALTFDGEPIENSANLITSGSVYNALRNVGGGETYVAGDYIEIKDGIVRSTLGDGSMEMQKVEVFETDYLANGDNTEMPPFYIWKYLDNPTSFVVGDKVYLYCTDSSGIEKLIGEGVMEQNASIDTIFGSSAQIGCKFNISSSWSDLFGLSTGMPIVNPVDSSITINGNVAQFIFLQNLSIPNVVAFGAAQDYPNIKFRVSKDVLSTVYVKLPDKALTFDSEPTRNSTNLVNSGDLYNVLQNIGNGSEQNSSNLVAGDYIEIDGNIISSTFGKSKMMIGKEVIYEYNNMSYSEDDSTSKSYVYHIRRDQSKTFTNGDEVKIDFVRYGETKVTTLTATVSMYYDIYPYFVVNSTQTDPNQILEGNLNKIDPNLPAFMVLDNTMAITIYSTENYNGANMTIYKDVEVMSHVKLPNEALTFDNVPTMGSENLINSGDLYNIIGDINTVIASINTLVGGVS